MDTSLAQLQIECIEKYVDAMVDDMSAEKQVTLLKDLMYERLNEEYTFDLIDEIESSPYRDKVAKLDEFRNKYHEKTREL